MFGILFPNFVPCIFGQKSKTRSVRDTIHGALQIPSDGNDRMGANVKTRKNPQGIQQNPPKSLDQKLTPKKSQAKFLIHK